MERVTEDSIRAEDSAARDHWVQPEGAPGCTGGRYPTMEDRVYPETVSSDVPERSPLDGWQPSVPRGTFVVPHPECDPGGAAMNRRAMRLSLFSLAPVKPRCPAGEGFCCVVEKLLWKGGQYHWLLPFLCHF